MIYALMRLAIGKRGSNLGHLVGVTWGLTLAVLVLLVAIAVSNGLARQARIVAARDGTSFYGEQAQLDASSTNILLRSTSLVPLPEGAATITRLAQQGNAPSSVPGFQQLPAPGTVLVSPALAAVLAANDETAATMLSWLPHAPTGVLPQAALAAPTELVALVIVSPADMQRTGWFEIVNGVERSTHLPVQRNPFIILLAVVAILIPIASLIGVAVRLSATRRDQRSATLRLVGATPAQVRTLLVAETALAATLAYGVALVMATALRASTSQIVFAGSGFFTRDLFIAPLQLGALWVIVLGVAGLVAAVATRRLNLSPLQVQRRSERTTLRWTRSLWIGTGCVVLFGVLMIRNSLPETVLIAGELLALGLLATGLMRCAPLVIRAIAPWAMRTPATTIAARRLQFDPQLGVRVVVGLALAAFAFGMLQVVGPGVVVAPQAPTRADVVVEMRGVEAPELPNELQKVPGVRASVPIYQQAGFLPDGNVATLAIGTCDQMVAMLRVRVTAGGCAAGDVLLPMEAARALGVTPGQGVLVQLLGSQPGAPTTALELVVSGTYQSEVERDFGLLVDIGATQGQLQTVYVATDGRPETQQRVFATVTRVAPGVIAATPATLRMADMRNIANLQRMINAVLLGSMIIGIAAFSYGVLGLLVDRRTLMVTLRAVGLEPQHLFQLLAVEVVVPLFAAVGVSLVLGFVVGAVVVRISGTPHTVPLQQTLAFVALILVAMGVALLFLALYANRTTARPPERVG